MSDTNEPTRRLPVFAAESAAQPVDAALPPPAVKSGPDRWSGRKTAAVALAAFALSAGGTALAAGAVAPGSTLQNSGGGMGRGGFAPGGAGQQPGMNGQLPPGMDGHGRTGHRQRGQQWQQGQQPGMNGQQGLDPNAGTTDNS